MRDYKYFIAILIVGLFLGFFYYKVETQRMSILEEKNNLENTTELIKEQNRIDQEKLIDEKQEEDELKLKECLRNAHQNYVDEGLVYCKAAGFTEEQFDNLECEIDLEVIQRLEKKQREEQELCIDLYK